MSPERDIHLRIYSFVIRVINLTKAIPQTLQNNRVILQLIDSTTSIGANDQEAEAASSKKDFIQKYSISKKECKESLYWLKIISEINPEYAKRMTDLIIEGNEILKIISAIIISAKKKF